MRKVFILILILMINACSPIDPSEVGSNNSVEKKQIAYGLLGPGPINYGVIRDDQDEYRYDGLINQSTSFRTLDRHRHDLGDDEEIIRSILIEEVGVRPGTIFILGKDVYVSATLATDDKKERDQKKADLQKLLSKVMQSYDIHLRINE